VFEAGRILSSEYSMGIILVASSLVSQGGKGE
jgi:hypothetical protein